MIYAGIDGYRTDATHKYEKMRVDTFAFTYRYIKNVERPIDGSIMANDRLTFMYSRTNYNCVHLPFQYTYTEYTKWELHALYARRLNVNNKFCCLLYVFKVQTKVKFFITFLTRYCFYLHT